MPRPPISTRTDTLCPYTTLFLSIFTLEAQEGRLFGPLAFTKTFAMAAAALLSVTLVPALMVIFVRGRIVPEHRNPINRFLIWIYRPAIRGVLKAKTRSEEHTSELQSLMRISYAVFCLKKKKNTHSTIKNT